MRAKEIRERADADLLKMKQDAESQLFQDRLKNAVHQLDNTSKIRHARRNIARMATVLRERELQKGSAPAEKAEE